MGAAIFAKPKPKLLSELGIETQAIYRGSFAGNQNLGTRYDPDDDYEDDEDETFIEEPLNWSGLVEINTIFYPTMKGTLEVDQKGSLYVVMGTLTLPKGTAELKDEFDFLVKCQKQNYYF